MSCVEIEQQGCDLCAQRPSGARGSCAEIAQEGNDGSNGHSLKRVGKVRMHPGKSTLPGRLCIDERTTHVTYTDVRRVVRQVGGFNYREARLAKMECTPDGVVVDLRVYGC